jgi:hypothetical protein
MTTLIATSVVRGSQQGESHGGVFLVDLDQKAVVQTIDWNTTDIDWQGRGWDRGLRGIAFDDEHVYIAASDELFVYTPQFERVASYKARYLRHCHEIHRYRRRLYLTSTGFDSILGFDLDNRRFSWGLNIQKSGGDVRAAPFNPLSQDGPLPSNQLHLNSVYCSRNGMFISGLRTEGILRFSGKRIDNVLTLPHGIHNAQPFRDGVVFNDTMSDLVRYAAPDSQCAFAVPRYDPDQLTHTRLDDSRTARQAFGRGLCTIDEGVIAAGSSPSTIALHDIDRVKTTLQITLSFDVRNAIHGLEVWPFETPMLDGIAAR